MSSKNIYINVLVLSQIDVRPNDRHYNDEGKGVKWFNSKRNLS